MKAYLSQFITIGNPTFAIGETTTYHALNDFHFHPEMELIYIEEGEGTLLIGDKLEQLSSDCMIMIGGNVPHMFKFEKYTYQDVLRGQGKIPLSTKLITLHFNAEVLGENFLLLSENNLLNKLFKDALKGIYVYESCKRSVLELMQKLTNAQDYECLLLIMQLFTTIAVSEERAFISMFPDKDGINKSDEKRLTKIFLYTLDNFSRTITLKEVASIVYMVPHAFCRYFKSRTNKSYFTFLMEIRIRNACKLLKEEDFSIVAVSDLSGFTNLSNFNRHFKLLTGKTPLAYRRYFQGKDHL